MTGLYDLAKQINWLRSLVYLIYEGKRSIFDSGRRDRRIIAHEYERSSDPYDCLSGIATECYDKQLNALDSIRRGNKFKVVLEIGCSKGVFTERLASRCEKLVAVDISAEAVEAATNRFRLANNITVKSFDLRKDLIEGKFDLIIVSGVLEYFHRPSVLWAVREKLVDGMVNGGYILIDTTRGNQVVENAIWSNLLVRGTKINEFFAKHSGLQVVSTDATSICRQTLLRKVNVNSPMTK